MPAFYLTHLYPYQMSIYGDMGNIIAIKRKLAKLGFQVVYQAVDPGQELPIYSDFYFIGGGQDKEQYEIYQDLYEKKSKLIQDVDQGVPLLSICGGYQLLGQQFLTGDGLEIGGIGIFPVKTSAPDSLVKSRCVGNIVVECQIPELNKVRLVGFENHSGQTYFTDNTLKQAFPLGKTVVGFGNNSIEKIEGCVYKNAIGTYLHGSCLPKNPELANFLIRKALEVKSQRSIKEKTLAPDFDLLDDTISQLTRDSLISRFVG